MALEILKLQNFSSTVLVSKKIIYDFECFCTDSGRVSIFHSFPYSSHKKTLLFRFEFQRFSFKEFFPGSDFRFKNHDRVSYQTPQREYFAR